MLSSRVTSFSTTGWSLPGFFSLRIMVIATVSAAARWTYQDGQLVKESTQTVAPTKTAVSEFHISKPDGWPVGSYMVEVLLNGSSTQKIDFKVV